MVWEVFLWGKPCNKAHRHRRTRNSYFPVWGQFTYWEFSTHTSPKSQMVFLSQQTARSTYLLFFLALIDRKMQCFGELFKMRFFHPWKAEAAEDPSVTKKICFRTQPKPSVVNKIQGLNTHISTRYCLNHSTQQKLLELGVSEDNLQANPEKVITEKRALFSNLLMVRILLKCVLSCFSLSVKYMGYFH